MQHQKIIPECTAEQWYESHADLVFEHYENIEFAKLHASFLSHLPKMPCSVLEIGSGSGRDAAGLASLGHEIVAVEPSDALRTRAQTLHQQANIRWIKDRLPALGTITPDSAGFDVIFLSAVWMHLPLAHRKPAFVRISGLLRAGGLVYITLRHGPFEPVKGFWDIADDEVVALASELEFRLIEHAIQEDLMKRVAITWSHFVFQSSNEKCTQRQDTSVIQNQLADLRLESPD